MSPIIVSAISWASQTALRDVIGKTMLSDMLEGRDKISESCRRLSTSDRTLGHQRHLGGVKDVLIPPPGERDVDAGPGGA